MTTQIAVRLPDDVVSFLDGEVAAGRAPSRTSIVLSAIEADMRRRIAERDAEILRTLGAATIALSMLVAGSRFAMLKFETILGWRIWFVSAIRLVAIPLVMIPLLALIPMDPDARGILYIIAVMPSAMVSVLFSERYGGDTDFIAGGLLLTLVMALH